MLLIAFALFVHRNVKKEVLVDGKIPFIFPMKLNTKEKYLPFSYGPFLRIKWTNSVSP